VSEKSDLGAEVFGISGDLEKGLGGGPGAAGTNLLALSP